MSDRSLPVGDRNEPPAVRGPAMVREALATQPTPVWLDQVVDLARRHGWAVMRPGPHSDPGHPGLLLVRDGCLIAAWASTAPAGYKGDEWKARLRRVPGVETVAWRSRDGLAAVEEALR